MIRATIVQVLDKAWLEVELLEERHGSAAWRSIGRLMLQEAEEVVTAWDGVAMLKVALTWLEEELGSTWKQLEPHRI